jgi:hypothetical protein
MKINLSKVIILLLAAAAFNISASAVPVVNVSDGQISGVGSITTLNVMLSEAPNGLSGYNITVSLSNSGVAEIISVEFPGWASLNSNGSLPADSVFLKAADLNNQTKSGATNVLLATLTVRGDAQGSSEVRPIINQIDDDNGGLINTNTISGKLDVGPLNYALISIPNKTIPKNGNVTNTINIENATDFGTVTMDVSFNNSVINVESISNGDIPGSTITSNIDNVNGKIRILVYSTELPGPNGNFNIANFTIKSIGPSSSSWLNIDVLEYSNPNGMPLSFIVKNGYVRIGLKGDVNNDDKISGIDAMWIAQYVVGKRPSIDQNSADVNNDGKVSGIDAMWVAQYVVGKRVW